MFHTVSNISLSFLKFDNSLIIFADLNEDEELVSEEIISRHDYYPFGLEIDGEWNQQNHYAYRYNGKEEQEFGWYNYGARFYDPSIGRFLSVDPLSEIYSYQSPYAYADNNPIKYIDFLGLGSSYNWDNERYEDEDGNEVSWNNVKTEYGISNDNNVQFTSDNIMEIENDAGTLGDRVTTFNTSVEEFFNKIDNADVGRHSPSEITININIPVPGWSGNFKSDLKSEIENFPEPLRTQLYKNIDDYKGAPRANFDQIIDAYFEALNIISSYPNKNNLPINVLLKTSLIPSKCEGGKTGCGIWHHGADRPSDVFFEFSGPQTRP